MTPIRGDVFAAYGTLFDVHSVVEAGRAITRDPTTLSATWRQKQLGAQKKGGPPEASRPGASDSVVPSYFLPASFFRFT